MTDKPEVYVFTFPGIFRRRCPEVVFEESLRLVPNDPRALLGLSSALAAEGRKSDAAAAKTHFEAARQHSDVPLNVKDL